MGLWGNYLLLFRFAAECYTATYIFTFTLLRRKRFAQRMILSAASVPIAILLLAAFCTFSPLDEVLAQSVSFGIIISIVNFAWLAFCFRDSAWNLVFCTVFGLMTKQGTTQLIQALRLAVSGRVPALFAEEGALGLFTQYSVVAVTYVAIYLTVAQRFERGDSFIRCGKRIIPLYLLAAITMPLVGSVLNNDSNGNLVYPIVLNICAATICFLVIQVQFSFSREIVSVGRSAAVDALLAESQKQYNALKESMEIINLKCHDLRHQLRTLKQGVDQAYLDELSSAIEIYDSSIHTGNDVLDVVLTDKSLRCSANQIQFTCIAEGELLSFMAENDINSLFGNILENAMDYEYSIKDEERRYVSLVVRASAGVLFIRAENYWCGEPLQWNGGLPVTTKGKDGIVHGFGMRSIRWVVEKYGGELQVRAEDDLFQVIAAIPIP